MFARGLAIVAAACLLLPSASASASALAAQPIGDWKIEPSNARCVAVRKYGPADKPITLALKAPPTGHALQLAIIRHVSRRSSDQVSATVGVDGRTFSTYALGYPVGYPAKGSKRSVSLIHLAPEAAAAIREAGSLGVMIKGSPDERFPLGNMTDAWAKMDACLERLRETWNLGEANARRIATDVSEIVPLRGMFSPLDYPPQAAGKNFGGTTAILLLIDETGAVKDCTLTESSGMAVIDSRTCAVITYKGRFKPAIGTDGNPTKSSWTQRITWRVEN